LETLPLSLYQRMRFVYLKKSMRDNIQKVNIINLNNKLPFEKVIFYDDICSKIININFEVIEQNIDLWKQLSEKKLNMQEVLQSVQEIDKNCM
jgi:hypothetical protein